VGLGLQLTFHITAVRTVLWLCEGQAESYSAALGNIYPVFVCLRYWHQRAKGMATLPQGIQQLLMVRDNVGRPPGELGVRKSMECGIFSLQCFDTWLGARKGIWPIKNWMLVCWW